MNLDEIALKHKCLKGSQHHNYTGRYQELLGPHREKVKTVLELGIEFGLSLKMWRDYFPNAMIYGLDTNPTFANIHENRIKGFVGCQEDIQTLQKVSYLMDSSIDVVIDDCCHLYASQMMSFGYLVTKLKPGGYYFIEDVSFENYDYINVDLQRAVDRMGIQYLPPWLGSQKQYLFALRKDW